MQRLRKRSNLFERVTVSFLPPGKCTMRGEQCPLMPGLCGGWRRCVWCEYSMHALNTHTHRHTHTHTHMFSENVCFDPVSIMRSQEKQMRVWECGCASSYVGVHVCLCMTMKVQTKSQDQVSGTLLAEVNCERPCGPTFSINPEIELQQFIVKSHSRSLNPSANKQLSMESTGSGWADMN